MKKLTVTLLAIPALLAGTAVFAGMNHDGYSKCDRGGKMFGSDKSEKRAGYIAKKMSKKLGLSDTQQVQVEQLFSSKQEQRQGMYKEMQELHQATRDLDPNAADYSTRLADTKKAAADMAVSRVEQQVGMRADMAKILTAEQMAKFEEMRDKFGKGRGKNF
ncbi:Spy/CpxP family protein refolding chaperone [Neptunomonas sp.]|uniref:Spy/CpxP family protein refolding chaperone n=1 Tax=Neptunomonas sp. TaxID=1971898 RepID=UPI0025E9051B|nr:Spy/CpxP family protein refolding chaperone [Neptunomonas sp.]